MILGSSSAAQDMAQQLGVYLKSKRMRANLSQGEVSKYFGYSSPQFISNIERGRCFPPMDTLKTMMELYKISASEMTILLSKLQKKYFAQEFSTVGILKSRPKIA